MRHADSEKLLGYELRRNGKAIGFTTSDTYTDDLGAANNLTYRYSVVPVDKLGNLGVEASSMRSVCPMTRPSVPTCTTRSGRTGPLPSP